MSGESTDHITLVERLIAAVEQRHQTKQGIMILADHRKFGINQPPTIGGFKPDVLAHDLPATFRVIGEAKTMDLGDDRCVRQVAAFLDHLALYKNSAFYLAVPWFLQGRARNLLRTLRKAEHEAIRLDVLSMT